MQEWVGHCGRCGIDRGEEHCERCGICRSRWDIARRILYVGGDGTLSDMWNMLEEVGHS
jgi:hypothetical protein